MDRFGANMLVLGVGGAGNNAVNRMIKEGVRSARLVAVNTDVQDLESSAAPKEDRLQIGEKVCKGIGAGADPKVGAQAAASSLDKIREILRDVDLLFIAAGMGGGTGTGAAPVIAEEARRQKILTIAVVTMPFSVEGEPRRKNAEYGVENLKKYVDSMIIVPNERVHASMPDGTSFADVMEVANNVLRIAVQSITDIVATKLTINVDLADVRTVVEKAGRMHIGHGEFSGEYGIVEATKAASCNKYICSNIAGASKVLMTIRGGANLTQEQVMSAGQAVRNVVAKDANIIIGFNNESTLEEDEVIVTIIATGLDGTQTAPATPEQKKPVLDSKNGFSLGIEGRVDTTATQQRTVPTPATAYPPTGTYPAPNGTYPAPTGGAYPPANSPYGTYTPQSNIPVAPEGDDRRGGFFRRRK